MPAGDPELPLSGKRGWTRDTTRVTRCKTGTALTTGQLSVIERDSRTVTMSGPIQIRELTTVVTTLVTHEGSNATGATPFNR